MNTDYAMKHRDELAAHLDEIGEIEAAHWVRQVGVMHDGFVWLRTVTHEAGVIAGSHQGSIETCKNRGCTYAMRVIRATMDHDAQTKGPTT